MTLDHLLTEAQNPHSMKLDRFTPLELVQLMNAEDAKIIPAVASQAEAIAKAIERIADAFAKGARLVYQGAGTSGRLGVLDASECPPTFNAPPEQVVGLIAGGTDALTRSIEGAEDDPDQGAMALQSINFSSDDILVGIATSGRTPYVLGGVDYARRLGATTVGLSCNPDSELSQRAEIAITVAVGPEVLSGSTRLKAGTATKMVLNMLTTGAWVQVGKTYGNLMVDLRAVNSKLHARTNRIVRLLTGLSAEEAAELLDRCNGELKTALVAAKSELSPEEARQRLRQVGGQVAKAIPEKHGTADTLCLGVDGGGSHTIAWLAEVTSQGPVILGRGKSGPSNPRALGAMASCHAIEQAIQAAFQDAKRPPATVQSACFGIAGAGREQEQQAIEGWAKRQKIASDLRVVSDAELLLHADPLNGTGIALIAGTGSMAIGRTSEGRTFRAGGWGYLLDDAGSGYRMASAALLAIVRAADGRGPKTALTEVFLQQMALQKPEDLIAAIHSEQWPRSRVASLAPLVLDHARTDSVANEIVDQGVKDLAELVTTVHNHLWPNGNKAPLALAGGLFRSSDYQELVTARLSHCEPVQFVEHPVEGAVSLAVNLCVERTEI